MEQSRLDFQDVIRIVRRASAGLARIGVIALWSVREVLRTAWGIARGPLISAFNVVAALIVLFEEWGWRPLAVLLGRLAAYAPIAAIERWIAGLPPYGALVVFALPTTLLLPLKLVAVWLLAHEYFATATLLFFSAKVASTALIARVFILTKPSLMRIEWFARLYNWFVPWKDALFAEIRASWIWRYGRMVKTRVKIGAGRAWARMQPRIAALWLRWTGREMPVRIGGRAGLGSPGGAHSSPRSGGDV